MAVTVPAAPVPVAVADTYEFDTAARAVVVARAVSCHLMHCQVELVVRAELVVKSPTGVTSVLAPSLNV